MSYALFVPMEMTCERRELIYRLLREVEGEQALEAEEDLVADLPWGEETA